MPPQRWTCGIFSVKQLECSVSDWRGAQRNAAAAAAAARRALEPAKSAMTGRPDSFDVLREGKCGLVMAHDGRQDDDGAALCVAWDSTIKNHDGSPQLRNVAKFRKAALKRG